MDRFGRFVCWFGANPWKGGAILLAIGCADLIVLLIAAVARNLAP